MLLPPFILLRPLLKSPLRRTRYPREKGARGLRRRLRRRGDGDLMKQDGTGSHALPTTRQLDRARPHPRRCQCTTPIHEPASHQCHAAVRLSAAFEDAGCGAKDAWIMGTLSATSCRREGMGEAAKVRRASTRARVWVLQTQIR